MRLNWAYIAKNNRKYCKTGLRLEPTGEEKGQKTKANMEKISRPRGKD